MISALAAGAVAAAVATAPVPKFGLGIAPAVVTGPATSVAVFTVRDAGSTPLHLRVQAVEERPTASGAWTAYGEFDQATVSPERFNLAPGNSHPVRVTVRATDGYTHRIAVTAYAESPSVRSAAAVSPAVAGLYKIPGKPNPLYAHPRSVPQPQPPAAPFPWAPIGVGVLLALILAALVQAGRKLRITRR